MAEAVAQEDGKVQLADDDLQKLPGGGLKIKYEGVWYELTPLNEIDFQEIEQYLRLTRYSPVAVVEAVLKDAKDPEVRRELIDRAYRDLKKSEKEAKLPLSEVTDWLNGFEGLAYSVHMQMARAVPEITLERVKKLLVDVGMRRARELRDESSRGLVERAGVHRPA